MPMYNYICDECGRTMRDVRPMKDRNKQTACECGHKMRRDWSGQQTNIGGDVYRKPIVSDSLAINPSQIQEHREMFPDVKVHPDGRPEFTSFRQHENYLKKTGFVKAPQRIRRSRGTRLN